MAEFGQAASQTYRNIEVLGAWSPTGYDAWLVVRCWSTNSIQWLTQQTELVNPLLGPVGVTIPSWHGNSKAKLWYMVGSKGPLVITAQTDSKRILEFATDLGLPDPLWGIQTFLPSGSGSGWREEWCFGVDPKDDKAWEDMTDLAGDMRVFSEPLAAPTATTRAPLPSGLL